MQIIYIYILGLIILLLICNLFLPFHKFSDFDPIFDSQLSAENEIAIRISSEKKEKLMGAVYTFVCCFSIRAFPKEKLKSIH